MLTVVNNGTHFLRELGEALEALGITYGVVSGCGSLGLDELAPGAGIILTGGEVHVYEPEHLAEVAVDEAVLSWEKVPILGICLGHQLIAHHYGAEVTPLPQPVDQYEVIRVRKPDPLFEDLPRRFRVRVAHDDTVTSLPEPLVQLASSRLGRYEAIRHVDRPIYGLQFHPEASGREGLTILSNFARLCRRFGASEPARRRRATGPA